MGLVNVDIDLLRTLLAVADAKNFTLAGERLLRTQSAVSLQVKRLEQVVGQRLVERGSGREIRLTEAGEMVRRYAIEILKLNDALVREVAHRPETNVLRVGTPDDYAQLILPEIIGTLSRENRHVEFHVVSDLSVNLSRMVDSGDLDLALVTWASGIQGIRLAEEPLAWVAAPHSAAASLDTLPLALFPQGCRVRDMAVEALDRIGRRWRVAFSANQFTPLRTAITHGEAIGVLPLRAVPKDLVQVGPEHGLPELPCAPLIIKIGRAADDSAHQLAGAIAYAFQPRPLASAATGIAC
ncbi:transcriptional regulator, LysR family [Methylobacterium sp. 4-46]|uniref:LysR substrate-binding domain-containing protein n=1 Tax=unclassified Methylobacterium TaxID=2615210 RepID=UPI000152C040|nr:MULTISPECIES: LysR substrate-binding domain-containing protein [Methylobacterium]ACA19090.1 transcriptional regulator, LysR family [Methylobacterium sp. 4-46]WFT78302.1 LysR substrate-binding domain-containing protein [Methylobacterium nodulans]